MSLANQKTPADSRHGGKDVSNYLRDHLHELLESVDPAQAEELVRWTKETHGGYFRRWRGGVLNRFAHSESMGDPTPDVRQEISLEERMTMAFLQVITALLLEAIS